MQQRNGLLNCEPLQLGIDPSGWRAHGPADHANRRLLSAAGQVLKRANYTCVSCGFRSLPDAQCVPDPGAAEINSRSFGYLQVHPCHGDHERWRLDDLLCVCPFCHETLHCGSGMAADSGMIVWCPWLAQRDLCLLCNVMAVAGAGGEGTAHSAEQFWGQLERLQRPAAALLNVQHLSCGLLGASLLRLRGLGAPLYERRERALQSLRYVPDRKVFTQAVTYWQEAAWAPVSHWKEIHNRWLRAQELLS